MRGLLEALVEVVDQDQAVAGRLELGGHRVGRLDEGAAQADELVRHFPSRLGDVEADLDIGWRQQAHHHAARRNPVADDKIRIADATGRRRGNGALRQSPIRLRERIARRGGVGLRGANLVRPTG